MDHPVESGLPGRAGDEDLWSEFVAGGDECLARLMERHNDELYWYLLLSTGSQPAAARHLAQTWTLLARWRRPMEGFSSFRAWLYAVATQNCVPPTQPDSFELGELVEDLKARRGTTRLARLFYAVVDMRRMARQPFLLTVGMGLRLEEAAAACRLSPEQTALWVERGCRSIARSGLLGRVRWRRGCGRARGLIARALSGELSDEALERLEKHLSGCPRCAEQAEVCRLVREEFRGMKPVAPPRDFADGLVRQIGGSPVAAEPRAVPPAVPRPACSGLQKAALFLAAMALLAGGTVGMLLLARRGSEPPVRAGELMLRRGIVQVREPGEPRWRALPEREFLLQGVAFRTGPDGRLRVRSGPAEWWAGGGTALALIRPGEVDLAGGWLYAVCEGGAGEGARLVAPGGIVRCAGGRFVAFSSRMRLRVACLSGSVSVGGGAGGRRVGPGEVAMLAAGKLIGPVRRARPADIAAPLRRFQLWGERNPSMRELASVPLATEPLLPDRVRVESLELSAWVRGALALLRVRARLRNEGTEPWRGAVDVAGAVLPPPLAQVGDGSVDLEPGQGGTVEAVLVLALPSRRSLYCLGLLPAALTRLPVGRMTIEVDADGAGGPAGFGCPAQGRPVGGEGPVRWSWRGEEVGPLLPVLIEMELPRAGADAVGLATEDGEWALVAWRPQVPRDEWIRRGRNVLVGFDGGGDFGPGGRVFAQQVVETIVGALPRGVSTGLLAYDGRVLMGRRALALHDPVRADGMLARLWGLERAPRSGVAELLRTAGALAGAAERKCVLLLVTGRGETVGLPSPAGGKLRIGVIQVGAEAPADGYRRLCARSGGAAFAVPARQAAELGAVDFLAGLDRAGLSEVSLTVEGPGVGRILIGGGGPAEEPVLALVKPGRGVRRLRCGFSARAGDRSVEERFELSPARAPLGADEAAELVRLLEEKGLGKGGG